MNPSCPEPAGAAGQGIDRCPLCGHNGARPSWLGSSHYRGQEFPYRECLACGSLFCHPMPDPPTLAAMYGGDYLERFAADPNMENPKEPQRVVAWLRSRAPGTFVDYGCGSGALLTEAATLHWEAIGVEFGDDAAREAGRRTGLPVLSRDQLTPRGEPFADVLHLGDVIEHLTEIDRQMPEILGLIKPGGVLLAQGPLEANASLFTLALRLARSVRRPRRNESPPYHVLLVTSRGQRALFNRFGLTTSCYELSEVSWPAPSRLPFSKLSNPRHVSLFALRRVSQAVSSLRPTRWGNRYFYAGLWNPSVSAPAPQRDRVQEG